MHTHEKSHLNETNSPWINFCSMVEGIQYGGGISSIRWKIINTGVSYHQYGGGASSVQWKCMIKIFWGAGVVTPSKPPPPMNNFCFYPPPVLRCFWKDPLMTPTTPLQTSFTATPFPSPLPPKNFDHTRGHAVWTCHIISTEELVQYMATKTAQGVVGGCIYLGKWYFTDNITQISSYCDE